MSDKLRIVLLGDSTVIGTTPRFLEPKADHLEDIIRKLLAAEAGLPEFEVVNLGANANFVRNFLDNSYAEARPVLGRATVIAIRFGINDYHNRSPFPERFKADLHELIGKLRVDAPAALVVLETVIPYRNEKETSEINQIIKATAAELNLPLTDIHARMVKEINRGNTCLTYRYLSRSTVPAQYHGLLPGPMVPENDWFAVMDNRLDAHLADVPGWFDDKHPNLAGYHIIGSESAEALAGLLRKKFGATADSGKHYRSGKEV
jgi:lysophospholipase L1-like esterase